jgi:hypothetical protein
MKNFPAYRVSFLALSAALTCTTPLRADDPIETPWNDVCKVASGQQLTVTTIDGATVEGYCIRINADGMGFRTLDSQAITIARTAISRVRLRAIKGRQLKSLGKGLQSGLRQEAQWLLSPAAPLGLVALPATLAWGAAAAPFCMLGDFVSKIMPERDIKLLADPAPTKNSP